MKDFQNSFSFDLLNALASLVYQYMYDNVMNYNELRINA